MDILISDNLNFRTFINQYIFMNASLLFNRFQNLPSKAQNEIADFIEFISMKYLQSGKNIKKKPVNTDDFKFNWEGSLSEYKSTYSSVDMQHKASEWRSKYK